MSLRDVEVVKPEAGPPRLVLSGPGEGRGRPSRRAARPRLPVAHVHARPGKRGARRLNDRRKETRMRNGETTGPALLELPRTEVRPPNIGSWEAGEARFRLEPRRARARLGPGRPGQHRLEPLGPDLPPRPRAEAGASLGGGRGAGAPLHLRRPEGPLEHDRRVARRAGSGPRRARLPLPRPRPRALPRVRRHPEARRGRPAALLGVRGRVARHAPPRRRHLLRRHPAEAPAEGPPRPRAPPRPAPRRRRRRRRREARGGRGRPRPRRRAARRELRRLPGGSPRRRRSSTTPRGRRDSRRGRSTSTARSSPST